MSERLVTVIGVVLSLGVMALGVFLVAVPLYFQALGVIVETDSVAQTNLAYQSQVEDLSEQQQNIDQINASVAGLRSQIPAAGQLDDVFEVVGRAAAASGVALNGVTAGERVAYATRTSAVEQDAVAPAPAPTPEPAPTAATPGVTEAPPAAPPGTSDVVGTGRQQVDFEIRATAVDMAQATAFLDALRAGPRLLGSVVATSTQSSGGGVDIQISALTYIDAEG